MENKIIRKKTLFPLTEASFPAKIYATLVKSLEDLIKSSDFYENLRGNESHTFKAEYTHLPL